MSKKSCSRLGCDAETCLHEGPLNACLPDTRWIQFTFGSWEGGFRQGTNVVGVWHHLCESVLSVKESLHSCQWKRTRECRFVRWFRFLCASTSNERHAAKMNFHGTMLNGRSFHSFLTARMVRKSCPQLRQRQLRTRCQRSLEVSWTQRISGTKGGVPTWRKIWRSLVPYSKHRSAACAETSWKTWGLVSESGMELWIVSTRPQRPRWCRPLQKRTSSWSTLKEWSCTPVTLGSWKSWGH